MKLYALRFIKTKKIVGVEINSDYTLEGDDNDYVIPYTEYRLSEDDEKIWCSAFKSIAEQIVERTTNYGETSFSFPYNPYIGQLEVVEIDI